MTPKRPWLRWVLAALALLVFIIGLIVLERFVALDTTAAWVVRIVFIVLGLITAGTILWYLRPVTEPAAGSADDALLVIKAAQAKLPGASIPLRPIVLVIGPENATKTTLVARSTSANPELLAGASPTAINEAPVPTRDLNLWLMQQAVIAEVGSALLQDEKKWLGALRAFRAPRLGAAVKSNVVAPRSVVVCVPCDLFAGDVSADDSTNEAKLLRERLTDVSRELGMRVPVYVVFTRLDRIPHFEPWASIFTRDEVRAPLGASLPFDTVSDAATYGERTQRRLADAMAQLHQSIAARRVDLLGRDAAIEKRFEAYEFPRELRKRSAAMSKFMIELCRPTQLAASPLLRGFYFVGARPVVISEARAAAQPVQQVQAAAADATAIFRHQAAAPVQANAPGGAVTRKVPEWVFLDQLFRDVVLGDTGAASTARSGVRVQRTRRALVATAIAACLVLFIGTAVSWARNSSLNDRVLDASRAVAMTQFADESAGSLVMPSTEALRRLETLRGVLDTVRIYERDGVPLSMRFGLWRGQALLERGRPVWYEGFRKQLYASSMQAITDSLRALPVAPRPGDDYGRAYAWLKAYLVNTSETSRSTSDFLAPAMLASWQRGRSLDTDAIELARNQFVFFADDLPVTNYFNASANAGLVTGSRSYLLQFSGGEQRYRSLVAQADAQAPAIDIPQRATVLTAPAQVSGAFTRAGADFMEKSFRDGFSTGDDWVIGDAAATASANEQQLINEIRTRYQADYATQWQQVLRGTTVVRANGAKDAASKLAILSSAQSPLIQLLAITAQNTTLPFTRTAFQPVHAASDTIASGQLITDANRPYMDGLLSLQSAMNEISLIEGRDSAGIAALQQRALAVMDEVRKARVAAGQVAQKFTNEAEAQPVAVLVQGLLQAPIVGAEAVLQDVSRMRARTVAAPPAGGGGGAPAPPPTNPAARALNDAGAALCRSYGPMLSKFPFNRSAIQEATIDEVQKLLVQEYGELWNMQRGALAPYLVKQGNQWAPRAAGGVELSAEFVEFFNNAARVSEALFPQGAANPRFDVYASGRVDDNVTEIAFRHDVKDTRFNKQTFDGVVTWPAQRATVARIAARFKKNRRDDLVDSTNGTWALFRLVANSSYEGTDRTGTATWTPKVKDASPVRLVFTYPTGVPVLQPGWMGDKLSCVSQVTK